MASEPTSSHRDHRAALEELAGLRQSHGTPKEFWPRYLAAVGNLTSADAIVLLIRNTEPPSGAWSRPLSWPGGPPSSRLVTDFLALVDAAADRSLTEGHVFSPFGPAVGRPYGHYLIAVRIDLRRPREQAVIAALISESSESSAREALVRLLLAAETPELYQTNLAIQQARADVEKLAAAMDANLQLNAEKRFLAAALAFCNDLATRFKCDRVSLGWLDGGYVKLRAMSRTEKFDRRMVAAQELEAAMEEALDQDDEVVWPPPEGATTVSRDHERFVNSQGVGNVGSLPLRVDDRPAAVLTCERRDSGFSSVEVQQLRLACDFAARRLADLRHQDRWFGARMAITARRRFARWIGPEHTWSKLLALGIAAALALLILLRVTYRVEGNFLLRSEEVGYLTAPFDGYIEQVLARPGDALEADAPLLKLRTSELELEESAALADLTRFQREAEKSRAANALAEMRIAQSMVRQAQARLDLVRYRISEATLKTPFAGVVVEGDLRERLGAPVKQADVLLKMARIDSLYVEAEVQERDVHELTGRSEGEIAFVSQPRLKFPVRIVTVEKAAVPKDEANIFLVRCAVTGGTPAWWRPGMSGVCKFNIEKRSLLWIATHRTVDFLRMKLWW